MAVSLTVEDKHKLQLLENKVIIKICGPEKDEISGCRILCIEELRYVAYTGQWLRWI
jgi:hypothetical protein